MFVGIGFVAILTAAASERFMRERRADEAMIEATGLAQRLEALEHRGGASIEH
jgi:hypothetical protein